MEEELTSAVSDRDAFRGRAVEATASAAALAGQLGAYQLTKVPWMRPLLQLRPHEPRLWFGGGRLRVSFSPLLLFSFPYVHSLTPLCDAELGSEASRAAKFSRVEAQRLKEEAEASRAEALHWKEKTKACQVETRRWEQKAKGEFRGLPPLT